MILVARLYANDEKVRDIQGTPNQLAEWVYTFVGTNPFRAAMVLTVVPNIPICEWGENDTFDQQLTNGFPYWNVRSTDLTKMTFDEITTAFVRHFKGI